MASQNQGRRLVIKPAEAYETLVDVLRERAEELGDRRAFVFLADGEEAEINLTYADLYSRARAIAVRLLSQCAPGDRALLVYEPGLDYVASYFGCLFAGIIAVPAYPPDPGRLEKTLPRLQLIVDDSDPKVILTSSMVVPLKDFFVAMNPKSAGIEWINTEETDIELAAEWSAPDVRGDSVAFLQYTSGSTSNPRGVMVTHRNLLENLATSCVTGEYTDQDAFVSWLPQYHDMGLIGGIMQPLYGGFLGVLMSPMSFLQKPYRWLAAITKYNGRTSAFPNFALDLCTRKITPEQRDTLDLSSWKMAVNGAEPIRADSIERFAEYFAPCGFTPDVHCAGYGLAEATLIVTFNKMGDTPVYMTVDRQRLAENQVVQVERGATGSKMLAGCGRTLGDMRLLIVDPQTRLRCPPETVGEIWVMGSSLAQGYWNQPEETETTFRARLADTDEGPFLRTGDLGFLKDGELFVTGRLKDMIIVDGANHYPQDLEMTIETSHAHIRPGCCAVFSIDHDEGEQIVAVAETTRDYQPESSAELVEAARHDVASHHDVRLHDIVFLKTYGIPKTSSGKLQRHACRAGYLADDLERVGS